MSAIDSKRLMHAMDLAEVTPAELARRLSEDGLPVTISYVARICKGERRLKRNPALRAAIARALNVRRDWIEVERPEIGDAA